jgi:hypothetical protein
MRSFPSAVADGSDGPLTLFRLGRKTFTDFFCPSVFTAAVLKAIIPGSTASFHALFRPLNLVIWTTRNVEKA